MSLHMGHKSLELQLQLLNICHSDIFECTLSYIGNTVMLFTYNSNKVTLLREPRMSLFSTIITARLSPVVTQLYHTLSIVHQGNYYYDFAKLLLIRFVKK